VSGPVRAAAEADPVALAGGRAARGKPSPIGLHCLDCPMWYGAEDDGWGPCSIKHQRGDVRFLTYGGHACDEGYVPPGTAPGKAARLSGSRSTSRASAVGYSSTAKAGARRRPAKRRSRSGSSSRRRRTRSSR
jgi:hypothetical protein